MFKTLPYGSRGTTQAFAGASSTTEHPVTANTESCLTHASCEAPRLKTLTNEMDG